MYNGNTNVFNTLCVLAALLGDIRRADIPLHRANTLVAAIRLRASSLLWDAPGMPSDTGNPSLYGSTRRAHRGHR